EVDLGAAQLLAKLRLLGLALGFTPLEAPLRVLDLTGQTLGLLHEVQDLLLDPGLLLLDVLDLGEDRGILLVGLDLIKLALVLLPLDAVVLEVLLLGALALPGGVELGLGRLDRLSGRVHGGMHGGDLLRELRDERLEPRDPRVERLEVYERLELSVHLVLSRT